MVSFYLSFQQIKKLQQLTQSAALNRETIAASQLATSTSGSSQPLPGDSSTRGDDGSGSGVTAGEMSAAPAGSLQATRAGGAGGGPGGASSILTVDEDTLSLDRLNSLRIYMTSVKTLPFNLRIYG